MKNNLLLHGFILLCMLLLKATPVHSQVDGYTIEDEQINASEADAPSDPSTRQYPIEQYRDFDPERYQKAIEDVDYTEKKQAEEEQNRTKDFDFEAPKTVEFMGVGQIVLIVVLAVLLVVLLYLIVRQIPKSNPSAKATDDWFAEALEQDGGPELTLQKKLQEAIDQREYALALRMLFLQILADLHLSDTIAWKKDKTNATYIAEFGRKHNITQFRTVTYLYEFSWFGKAKLHPQQFSDYKQQFDEFRAFTSTLKKSEKA